MISINSIHSGFFRSIHPILCCVVIERIHWKSAEMSVCWLVRCRLTKNTSLVCVTWVYVHESGVWIFEMCVYWSWRTNVFRFSTTTLLQTIFSATFFSNCLHREKRITRTEINEIDRKKYYIHKTICIHILIKKNTKSSRHIHQKWITVQFSHRHHI